MKNRILLEVLMQSIQVCGCTVVPFQGFAYNMQLRRLSCFIVLETFSGKNIMLVVWLFHFIRHKILYIILAQIAV